MEQIDSLRAKTLYSHSAEDCSDACKDRGEKAVICLSVLVFGTNQLNVSRLIYFIRINIHYTYAFLSTGCGRLWVVDGQWKTNVCPLYVCREK